MQHITVLLNEAVNGLNIKPKGVYVDATFGVGGHSRLILQKLGAQGKLIALDRDPAAVLEARKIVDARFTFVHGCFSKLKEYLHELNLVGCIDGILIDLGVSSPQLDNAERGFSFSRDGPLDMRMDTTQGQSASDWLLQTTEQELAWVLKTFGEERFAKRIAKAIFERNRLKPIVRTDELVTVIKTASPYKDRHKHPATRTFQAIRIYINGELNELIGVLTASEAVLASRGRLSIISFHSLEDRIVKKFIDRQSRGPDVPRGIPLTEAELNRFGSRNFKSLGKYKPSPEEIAINPRARSAILRIAERL